MINQTCLTAPTSVPVEVTTHEASEPSLGTCRVLPTGQVGELADDEALEAMPVTATTQNANVAIARTAVATRTRRPFLEPEFRAREIVMPTCYPDGRRGWVTGRCRFRDDLVVAFPGE